MGYRMTMEKAGATVHRFKEYGSYQGDWLAEVTFDGRNGFVRGSYGSCSGCDAFQAECDLSHSVDGDYHSPSWNGIKEGCEQCAEAEQKFIAFGKSYLKDLKTKEEMIKELEEGLEWAWDKAETEEKLHFVDPNWTNEAREQNLEASIDEAMALIQATVDCHNETGVVASTIIEQMKELIERADND